MNPSNQPLMVGYFAWEKDEDGRYYYAAESVSRLFLQEAKEKHGIAAVRNFHRAFKRELEQRVRDREQYVVSTTQAVYLEQRPRTYEQMCAMLGVEPEKREVAHSDL